MVKYDHVPTAYFSQNYKMELVGVHVKINKSKEE